MDDSVQSPCINVCRMDDTSGLCVGCLRTMDEVAFWSVLDDDDRRAVWALIEQRRLKAPSLGTEGDTRSRDLP